jgi:hypothetical protein
VTPLEFKLYVALKDMLPDTDCNRLVHGVCRNRKCMIEGNWTPGDLAFKEVATCPQWRARQVIKFFDDALDKEI